MELSHAQAYERVQVEMKSLPLNAEISKQYCEASRWSGILNLDGKYVKILSIKSPNKKSIPFLYGIDFLSHDILHGVLVPAENEEAFLQFFTILKDMKYPLKAVVCDNVSALKPALFKVFPEVKIQLCHTHYFENMRKALHTRTDPVYRHFFNSCRKHIFRLAKNHEERVIGFAHVYHTHAKGNILLETILTDIEEHEEELFLYQTIENCPSTNNMIESSNSHLNGRLKTIKGFQTFHSARVFLNAWMLRRRTKPFTDCGHPFKDLNGTCSLQGMLKDKSSWPEILGISAPKTER
jgi:transposase-like protein